METTNRETVLQTDVLSEHGNGGEKKPLSGFSRSAWIWMGIAVSLIGSILFMACYGIFKGRAEFYSENPIEEDSNLTWIYQNNQVLYRDLYNLVNRTELSYVDLYYPLISSLQSYDPERFEEMGGNEGAADSGYEEERDAYSAYNNTIYARASAEEYFNELEHQFSSLNSTYDYLIRDLGTGTVVTNTDQKESLPHENYFFYLTFHYDENGNVSIGNTVKGENSDRIRKYVNEIIRDVGLPSDSRLRNESYLQYLKEYTDKRYPVNCDITYGIKQSVWAQMQSDTLTNDPYNNIWWRTYSAFVDAGCGQFFVIFLCVVFALAIFLPYAGNGKPWNTVKILRAPVELAAIVLILAFAMTSNVIVTAVRVATGRSVQEMSGMIKSVELTRLLVYGGNLLMLAVLFAAAWYAGICVRAMREYGFWEYIKRRSLIYRIFPFVKTKVLDIYSALVHFDVTRNARKLIIKVVLVNAVILFAISSLWFGGFAITIIYSVILYFVLKKYVSDLQKKYSILLSATNEIAMGNLNVSITEDLGVFEPFKPQIIRIQNGFKNAVEEEVKSQRMKAELITNVSHDLKTPLTAIITYIGLLKDENISAQQRREYMDTLERKSLRLKVLIEDLFEVSKATSKTVTLNIMEVDIMSLIKQVALEMSDKLNASRLDVRMNLTDSRVVLPLDSQKTYRIYENLFGNVAKYALPGTRVYVNGFRIDDTVVITIKNITAEEITVNPEELTDRFVRGDTARNTEGSGLGLAIAKSFTELQNGKLTLEMDGDLFKVTTAWKIPQQTLTSD